MYAITKYVIIILINLRGDYYNYIIYFWIYYNSNTYRINVSVIRSIDKVKMIKQTQLIHDKKHLKNLKNKEVLDNINCKI